MFKIEAQYRLLQGLQNLGKNLMSAALIKLYVKITGDKIYYAPHESPFIEQNSIMIHPSIIMIQQ